MFLWWRERGEWGWGGGEGGVRVGRGRGGREEENEGKGKWGGEQRGGEKMRYEMRDILIWWEESFHNVYEPQISIMYTKYLSILSVILE